MKEVELIVAQAFEVDERCFYLKARFDEVVTARYALFYVLKRTYKMTYRQLSEMYGFHLLTIRYGVCIAQNRIDVDPIFRKKMADIQKKVSKLIVK